MSHAIVSDSFGVKRIISRELRNKKLSPKERNITGWDNVPSYGMTTQYITLKG
jgi:hypothetical protein